MAGVHEEWKRIQIVETKRMKIANAEKDIFIMLITLLFLLLFSFLKCPYLWERNKIRNMNGKMGKLFVIKDLVQRHSSSFIKCLL